MVNGVNGKIGVIVQSHVERAFTLGCGTVTIQLHDLVD